MHGKSGEAKLNLSRGGKLLNEREKSLQEKTNAIEK